MEQAGEIPPLGLSHFNLKECFKLSISSLLTGCSQEEFFGKFLTLDKPQKERLHRLLIKVFASLYANIEEEFQSLCLETKVGLVLDKVEQLVDMEAVNVLSRDKTNLADIKQDIAKAKKKEIAELTSMIEKTEEANHDMRVEVETLKKGRHDFSTSAEAVRKLKRLNSSYLQST